LWQHGQEQHVTGFVSADDAQNWISRKSEEAQQSTTERASGADATQNTAERQTAFTRARTSRRAVSEESFVEIIEDDLSQIAP
jgi:hypothetical protein